jgi:NADPH:quinone reductase-like Zn-dependent oxidoreductase
MIRSIGADHVVDYTQQDFTKTGERYDMILDCIGNHSLSAYQRILNPNGILVSAGGVSGKWKFGLLRGLRAQAMSKLGSRKFLGMLARTNHEDLAVLGELVATGRITPVIDRRYGLSEVPEAVRYLEEGHARGKIIITCA